MRSVRRLAAIVFLACTFSGQVRADGLADAEYQALVDLYQKTGGDNWFNSLDGDHKWSPLNTNAGECDWYGVTCDASGTHVVGLALDSNGLIGTLPDSLGNLVELRTLGLSSNGLGGSLPETLGSLAKLQSLVLEFNEF